MIDLNTCISIDDFICRFKILTSAWITGDLIADAGKALYWQHGYYGRVISPEDKSDVTNTISSTHLDTHTEDVIQDHKLMYFDVETVNFDQHKSYHCHHLIFITSRGRLQLREKYKDLLSETMIDIANTACCKALGCATSRNHIHLLCFTPTDYNIVDIVDYLKQNIIVWMSKNVHFRGVDGLSDISLVFTVAADKIDGEMHNLDIQDKIHSIANLTNEMAYYHQTMDIPFILALR